MSISPELGFAKLFLSRTSWQQWKQSGKHIAPNPVFEGLNPPLATRRHKMSKSLDHLNLEVFGTWALLWLKYIVLGQGFSFKVFKVLSEEI